MRVGFGHLERFPPERLSGRCWIGQETSAGAYSGDGLAPTPAVRPTTASRLQSIHSGHPLPASAAGKLPQSSHPAQRRGDERLSRCDGTVAILRRLMKRVSKSRHQLNAGLTAARSLGGSGLHAPFGLIAKKIRFSFSDSLFLATAGSERLAVGEPQ